MTRRSLDQEAATQLSTSEVARSKALGAAHASAASGANGGMGIDAGAAGSSGSRDLHMTSVPPSYWTDKVDTENNSLKTAKDTK